MKKIKIPSLFALSSMIMVAVVLLGCSSSKRVQRVDANSTIDLSGNWNDTDSRLVAEEMLNTCLTGAWYEKSLQAKNGENPVVVVGQIRNLSTEHINVNTFVNDIQRVLLNSGKVDFVANSNERQELRKEIDDQAGNATDQTAKERGQETGADIMLKGSINAIEDREGGEQVIFYQIDLELTDLQSHKKLWIGDKKIKKYIQRKSAKL